MKLDEVLFRAFNEDHGPGTFMYNEHIKVCRHVNGWAKTKFFFREGYKAFGSWGLVRK